MGILSSSQENVLLTIKGLPPDMTWWKKWRGTSQHRFIWKLAVVL